MDMLVITAEDARGGKVKDVTFNKKNKPMDDIWNDGRRYKKGFKEGFIIKTLPEDWWIGIDIANRVLHYKHNEAEILNQKIEFDNKSLGIGSNYSQEINTKIIMLLKYALFQQSEIIEDLTTHDRWVKIVQDDVKYKTIKKFQDIIEKLMNRMLHLNDKEFFTKKKYVMLSRDEKGKAKKTEYPFYVCNADVEIITDLPKQIKDLGYNLDGTKVPADEPNEDIEIDEDNGTSDLSNTIRMMMKDDIDYFGQDADENLPDEE